MIKEKLIKESDLLSLAFKIICVLYFIEENNSKQFLEYNSVAVIRNKV